MSKPFDASGWLGQWLQVGTLIIACGRVSIVADLDGNSVAQQSLLSALDSKRGRREAIRDEALRAWYGRWPPERVFDERQMPAEQFPE